MLAGSICWLLVSPKISVSSFVVSLSKKSKAKSQNVLFFMCNSSVTCLTSLVEGGKVRAGRAGRGVSRCKFPDK